MEAAFPRTRPHERRVDVWWVKHFQRKHFKETGIGRRARARGGLGADGGPERGGGRRKIGVVGPHHGHIYFWHVKGIKIRPCRCGNARGSFSLLLDVRRVVSTMIVRKEMPLPLQPSSCASRDREGEGDCRHSYSLQCRLHLHPRRQNFDQTPSQLYANDPLVEARPSKRRHQSICPCCPCSAHGSATPRAPRYASTPPL